MVIKFIPDHQLYKHEKQFYDNRHMLDGETAAEYIPLLFDTFTGTNVIDTAEDEPIPPSLVLERGNFSLAVRRLPITQLSNKHGVGFSNSPVSFPFAGVPQVDHSPRWVTYILAGLVKYFVIVTEYGTRC